MRQTLRRLAVCDGKTIDRYLAHMTMAPGEEVVPVGDLLPSPKEGVIELNRFHKMLSERNKQDNNDVIGVQLHHPSSDVMRMLRATESATWPLFKNDVHSSGDPIKRSERRINCVDSGIVLKLQENNSEVVEVASYCPSIVFSGSRYTYFAPHVTGLAADRNGMVAFCYAAKWTPWDNAVLDSSHVVLRDGEPVRVGTTRQSGLTVQTILELAANCMSISADRKLRSGDLVVLAGFHSRLPVSTGGRFTVNMGPFGGDVFATLQ
jgi:2-keto-4-pentenoate hydratase